MSGAIPSFGAITETGENEMSDSKPARLFIALVVVSGLAVLGAIVAVCQDEDHRHRVASDLHRLGCETAALAH